MTIAAPIRLTVALILLSGLVGSPATAQLATSDAGNGPVFTPFSGTTPVSATASSDRPGLAEQSIDWLSKKLSPPAGDADGSGSGWSLMSSPSSRRATIRTAAMVTLVLSVSLLVMFVFRIRPGPRRAGLPEDVVAVLGQIPFGPNQSLRLVRLASKILLITTSPAGSQTLGEISDPEEVLQIESLCQRGKFDAIGHTLRRRARGTGTGPAASRNTGSRTLLEA